MDRKYLKLLMAAVLLALGCSLPSAAPINLDMDSAPPLKVSQETAQPLTIIIPNSDIITATPFLPLDPTARVLTPTPLPTPLWGGFPGPSVPPAVPIEPPAEIIEQPDGQINVLLLGSDQRPNSGGFRTDTIILLTLNKELSTVSMTSFPRDLYVYIPGWTTQRINTAQARGGFETTQATFQYNFGLSPDFFALVNFSSFTHVVDNLGGINVNVAWSLTDHREGHGEYTVPAGLVHMDGETALWYVRSRYTSSDFDRTRRQQEVMTAIFYRLISLDGIRRAPELYNLYAGNVLTNAAFSDVAPFLGLAAEIANNPQNVRNFAVGPSHVTHYRVPSTGAAVLLPDYDAISILLRDALNAAK